MKIKLGRLRRLVTEENVAAAGPSPGNLGRLLDDVARQFAAKMSSAYPGADDLIQQEANELKVAITATIKASAAKVKMSAAGKAS